MNTHDKPLPDDAAARDPAAELMRSDADMVRVLEDLIDVLIERGVIKFTDLPKPAQVKLLQRKDSRTNLAERLDLIGDDETGLI